MNMRMRTLGAVAALTAILAMASCNGDPGTPLPSDASAIFLHHSTGGCIWGGGVPEAIAARNASLGTDYSVEEIAYPDTPYPWNNYPADYYRLWVARDGTYSADNANTASLENLCAHYNLIIWKHCYPVTYIDQDSGTADPASDEKTLANYKAAYQALKAKMLSFPQNRFLVWTGAVVLASNCQPEQAQRLKDFRDWVVNEWDVEGDNIYDFWQLETEGGLYLLPEHAADAGNDHPSDAFSAEVAPKFAERIMDVLGGRGDQDPLTGL
jgi:hypothetical protein